MTVPGGTSRCPRPPHPRPSPGAAEQGVPRRDVRHFSLVSLASARTTRTPNCTATSGSAPVPPPAAQFRWQEVEGPQCRPRRRPRHPESCPRAVASHAPLWVGGGPTAWVRVLSMPGAPGRLYPAAASPLPPALRLELVKPGQGSPAGAAPGRTGPRPHPGADRRPRKPSPPPPPPALAPLSATQDQHRAGRR
ncbi:hypothetical protein LV779_05045 [Streptomyces thinghirensis]|nr:hypothetical protein [Streptomyces thinghirensis]